MKILVINAGSSSLKYQLIDMDSEQALAKGNCERIGIDGLITHKAGENTVSHSCDFPTHAEAFRELVRLLSTGEGAVISGMSEIAAVGHRVVQGAELFSASTLVSDDVIARLETVSDLAPLHNPANITAIKACQKLLDKSVPQVIVFDTAFHQTMPPKAYMYPIPYELYEKYSIRKYGFHGTSHRYVSSRLSEHLGKPLDGLKVITIHLGNGSSIAAIDGGKVVDTTMGFTPLDGLIMGTRSGSIDPSIVTYLQEKEGLDAKGVSDLLNKKSGYLGISGVTSDQRDLVASANSGNERAKLALIIQRYQIKKYIGSYAAVMGGVDYVVFTGGIGENSPETRTDACANMAFLGITINEPANQKAMGVLSDITTADSKTKVFIVPTNEELLIARDTKEIIGK